MLIKIKTPYENLLKLVCDNGNLRSDRTGTGTRSLFGHQMRYNLSEGFPLITTKKVHIKSVIYELLWFLRGESNIKWLNKHGVTIWDKWADSNGDLGPLYGKQWLCWPTQSDVGINQISTALDLLSSNPNSRRNIVSSWNVSYLPYMAIPPCHILFQFYVSKGKLSCQLYQRSADLFLGVPFNIASYALLVHMMAAQSSLGVGDLVWTAGDCHIYNNHMKQVILQISRKPRPYPIVILSHRNSIFDYVYEDIKIVGYYPHSSIKGNVSI